MRENRYSCKLKMSGIVRRLGFRNRCRSKSMSLSNYRSKSSLTRRSSYLSGVVKENESECTRRVSGRVRREPKRLGIRNRCRSKSSCRSKSNYRSKSSCRSKNSCRNRSSLTRRSRYLSSVFRENESVCTRRAKPVLKKRRLKLGKVANIEAAGILEIDHDKLKLRAERSRVLVRLQNLADANFKEVMKLGILNEITEAKRIEAALKKNRQLKLYQKYETLTMDIRVAVCRELQRKQYQDEEKILHELKLLKSMEIKQGCRNMSRN